MLFKLLLMIAVSAAVFWFARGSRETTSWWVSRLRELSRRMEGVSPIVLGVGLVVFIFFLLGIIILMMKVAPWTVKALYVFSTANIAFVVLTLFLDRFGHGWRWTVVKILLSLALGVSWLLLPSWLVYNLVGFICAIGFLQLFPSIKFRSMLALGIAIIVYDVVGVYLTGWIIILARGLTFVPPAVIYIPAAISATTKAMSMIGLGDILIGGMIMSMARRYSAELVAFAGYVLSIAMALGLAILSSHPVPATMFIVPIMLILVWYKAHKEIGKE